VLQHWNWTCWDWCWGMRLCSRGLEGVWGCKPPPSRIPKARKLCPSKPLELKEIWLILPVVGCLLQGLSHASVGVCRPLGHRVSANGSLYQQPSTRYGRRNPPVPTARITFSTRWLIRVESTLSTDYRALLGPSACRCPWIPVANASVGCASAASWPFDPPPTAARKRCSGPIQSPMRAQMHSIPRN